ncbi:MerR family transcriptional regulator [Actinophytocola sp. KF-1]
MRVLGAGDDATRVYTAGQVARVLGVAETTLRSWHRRYGVGPHAARAGAYRRYTADDIVRLQHMRELIESGMLASDAAKAVSGSPAGPPRALARLVDAARRLDNEACRAIVAETVQAFGVVTAWDEVCRPALADVEERQLAGGESCIPHEHVLSWGIASALHRGTPHCAGTPAVMLACTDGELHSLPLEALAAALAERRVPARVLGAAVPAGSLLEAVRTACPDVVVLWAHRPETADPAVLRRLRRFPVRVMTAGPGWPSRRGAEHLGSLTGALATLTG